MPSWSISQSVVKVVSTTTFGIICSFVVFLVSLQTEDTLTLPVHLRTDRVEGRTMGDLESVRVGNRIYHATYYPEKSSEPPADSRQVHD